MGATNLSFPDFTRHLFLSLTETVDSFAKGIQNQWTRAAKAYCFCCRSVHAGHAEPWLLCSARLDAPRWGIQS